MSMFSRLKTRLLLVVAVATLPLLLHSIYVFVEGRAAAQAAVEGNIRAILRSALVPETIVVDNAHQVLRIMAAADNMRSLQARDCEGLAERLLKTQTNFADFGAASNSGAVFCSGRPRKGEVSVADRRWFQEAAARGGFSDGEAVVGRVSGERTIVFGYPLLDTQGGQRAVLYGSLRLDWLRQLVARAPIGKGWVAAAHGIDGHIFARHPDAGGLQGQTLADSELMRFIQTRPQEAVRELAGTDGVRRIYGIAPLGAVRGDIYLVVGASPELVFAQVEAAFRKALLLSLLVAMASFALAWLAIHRDFLGFSSALGRAIERLTQGDLGARAGVHSEVAELQAIGDGFDHMAEELAKFDCRHRVDALRMQELNTLLDGVINSGESMVYVFDPEGRCLLANQPFARALDATPETMHGQLRETFLPPELARRHWENDRQVIITGNPLTLEEEIPQAGDGLKSYLSVKFPLRDADGKVYAIGGISNDITERKRVESERLLASMVFDASAEGILVTDAERSILKVNPRFCEITGYAAAEIIGQQPSLFKSGVHDEDFYRSLWTQVVAEGYWEGEITDRRRDGTLYPAWLSISAVRDGDGRVLHYIGLLSDLSQRKALDQRVQHLLNYDVLTGLPNRSLFMDRLQQALLSAQRGKEAVAVFWIDLARFRIFNDSVGHAAGDAVLAEVGRRLQRVARAGDSTARLSADEFGLLMVGFDSENDIVTLAQRVLRAISRPLQVDARQLNLTADIGIGVFPKDGTGAEELLKAAGVALARAKEAGGNSFRFFASGMDTDAERRLQIEAELRKALERGQLELYYQPQIELATGRVCGTEALLRWTHPVLGAISPGEFIPLAEDVGLIHSIGAWVLRCACLQNKAWLNAGLPSLPVAVNLSGKQFRQPDLLELIATVLTETGLPPALLEIELTESAFIGDVAEVAAVVRQIKALGVLLALDDFGTGYSSLSYLSGFPFDKIKLDQRFVQDITTNPVNAAIATATIAMGRSLDLVVLAEGVETDAQMAFLRSRRCEAIQGFLFSKALPVAEVTELLRTGRGLKVGAGGTARQTLLLVDDEPNILSALKRLLRRDGYQILIAENPFEALELLARFEVQVIISDQRMPGMSGTEFLEKAKRLYPDTVRIILSGHTDIESITSAINRGAIYHFLTKPWDDDALRGEVREAFRVAQGFARA